MKITNNSYDLKTLKGNRSFIMDDSVFTANNQTIENDFQATVVYCKKRVKYDFAMVKEDRA